jgi:hypothetical protein
MVLAPSVAGLFKWRQFEPEVILLAGDWYFCAFRFSIVRAGRARRPGHRLEVGPTLRPRNSEPIGIAAPTDQRQLAGGL